MKHQDNCRITEITLRDTQEAQLLGYLKAYLPQENFSSITSRLEGRGKVEVNGITHDLNHGLGRVGYLTARANAVDRYREMLKVANGFTAIWGHAHGATFYTEDGKVTNENINYDVLESIARVEGWTQIQHRWWKEVPK